MLLSLNWLRDFVPYEGEVQALADRLTMIGNEVEEVFNPFEQLTPLVVGHVVECEKHPEADKLSVCTVDVGDETLQIVCGAPNVAKGQKVPVAKVGTVLPGDLKLKKAKIRGVQSMGMICSERELELSEDHTGIMVLPDNLAPGENFVQALGLETTVFDIGITPNRADCLSVLGIARETAAAFKLPLTMPKVEFEESGAPASEWGVIEIPDSEYSPLYMARIIENVTIRKSPDWMRFRLMAIGQRPISNIVDVTNYVMFELGHPHHAFDMDLLRGGKIRVALAEEGMDLTTLDGQKRVLTANDLLIWDGEGPIALAGVMGGETTEINDESRNVLLECAVFRPGTIRKTARRLALPSEASYRFERGVDQVGARYALDRAAQLMAETAGGVIRPGTCEAEPRPWSASTLKFRPERCNRLLGHVFTNTFCSDTLEGLGCEVQAKGVEEWRVVPPCHRLDLEREVDLFEEVARMYGMDRIQAVIPRVSKSGEAVNVDDTDFGFLRTVKAWGPGRGLPGGHQLLLCRHPGPGSPGAARGRPRHGGQSPVRGPERHAHPPGSGPSLHPPPESGPGQHPDQDFRDRQDISPQSGVRDRDGRVHAARPDALRRSPCRELALAAGGLRLPGPQGRGGAPLRPSQARRARVRPQGRTSIP